MDQQLPALATWLMFGALAAVLVLLARQRHITRRLRIRIDDLHAATVARDTEVRQLAVRRLPNLVDTPYHKPVEVRTAIHRGLTGTEFADHLHKIVAQFADCEQRARNRAEESAKHTLRALMLGVQSLAAEQQVAISDMEDRHDDPDVLAGLLTVDHTNSQLSRRAQAIAVLCGAWPGQQRSASPVIDVVRGATSRIRDFLRVNIPQPTDIAVAARAVEPVVLAIAELLDNATRHSHPGSAVEVNFMSAHNGLAVMIDDAGVGMPSDVVERATRLLSGADEVDIHRLGDPPQVGFALVGALATRYGFTASVDTRNLYGGVRAVVFLPNELLTDIPTGNATVPTSAAAAVEPAAAEPGAEPVGRTPGGLPVRQRRQPTVASARLEPAPVAVPSQPTEPTLFSESAGGTPAATSTQAAAIGAWQRACQSGRDRPGGGGPAAGADQSGSPVDSRAERNPQA